MKKLLLFLAALLAPALAHATAATTTYSSSSGRWIATCPDVASSAECTLDCTHSPIALVCSDSSGCAWTMAETRSYFDPLVGRTASAFAANDECVVHVKTATGTSTFADSSGVQETDGTITVPANGILRFVYSGAAWGAVAPTGGAASLGATTVTGDLTVTGGDITGSNGEKLDIGEATDNAFTLTRGSAGTVTLTAADDDATAALTVAPGGAAAMVLGTASTTAHTITADSTGDGELTVPGESIAAAEITNLTRSVPLPLDAWVNCTTPAALDYSSGADASPDIIVASSVVAITYDDTGASIDTEEICTTFTVPSDYASGGSFVARATADAATAEIETFSCRISVDGAAVGAANAGNMVSQTPVQSVTSTPAGTWAAGASIAVSCKQGNASADDVVSFHSIEGRYTAVQ